MQLVVKLVVELGLHKNKSLPRRFHSFSTDEIMQFKQSFSSLCQRQDNLLIESNHDTVTVRWTLDYPQIED